MFKACKKRVAGSTDASAWESGEKATTPSVRIPRVLRHIGNSEMPTRHLCISAAKTRAIRKHADVLNPSYWRYGTDALFGTMRPITVQQIAKH